MKILRGGQRRRGRGLTEEDIAVWAEVARSVKRRPGAAAPLEPPSAPPRAEAAAKATAPRPAEPPPRKSPPPLAPIERKLKRDLARGRGAIDARLDLHGLTQAEAHEALRAFLVGAQARGDRLAIVVTGKGRASSWMDEPGVLRRLAPHWLRAPDLRAIVLGFEEAARHHGGAGALYVRLRRAR